jgi:hypothetical protein
MWCHVFSWVCTNILVESTASIVRLEDSEDGRGMLLWNTGKYPAGHMLSHPRRQYLHAHGHENLVSHNISDISRSINCSGDSIAFIVIRWISPHLIPRQNVPMRTLVWDTSVAWQLHELWLTYLMHTVSTVDVAEFGSIHLYIWLFIYC